MEIAVLPILLGAVGVYFLIKLRLFLILHPIRTFCRGMRSMRDKRVLRSFMLALAGTLGVGNVFGVAIAIIIGGPGSILWLLVSMIFAMVIKYAEVVISSDNLYHDTDTHGGFFYVIRASFKKTGKVLSLIYAAVTVLISFILGASLQVNAAKQTVTSVLDIPVGVIAIASLLITALAVIGGATKIEKITSILIPLTTVIYIISTLIVIFSNFSRISSVIEAVVKGALFSHSIYGGALGFLTSKAVSEGFARGLLSNEAGAGTSSMAHARSGVINPASAGIFGIFEVWFDTGVICLLTGLSILLSVPDIDMFSEGMQIVMYAVGSCLGSGGKLAIVLCVLAFAYATVICWYYYGSESWGALFGARRRVYFTPLFLLFVCLGSFFDSALLVSATDVLLTVATVLTLLTLIKNSDRIRDLSESGGIIDSDKLKVRKFGIKAGGFWTGGRHR